MNMKLITHESNGTLITEERGKTNAQNFGHVVTAVACSLILVFLRVVYYLPP